MKWNNEKIKQELKRVYDVPQPVKKKEFLKQFDIPHISMGKFMWEQLWYVKMWVWLLTGCIFILAIWLSKYMEKEQVWMIYALIPFLALTILTENAKSNAYGMDELEYATRFSIKNLLLARMGVLTILHGAVFLVIMVCLKKILLPMMSNVFYILVPYFFTVCLGFYFLRKFRGRESTYISIGISVFVSSFISISRQVVPFIYNLEMVKWWVAAFIFIFVFTIKEAVLFYKKTEELSWN